MATDLCIYLDATQEMIQIRKSEDLSNSFCTKSPSDSEQNQIKTTVGKTEISFFLFCERDLIRYCEILTVWVWKGTVTYEVVIKKKITRQKRGTCFPHFQALYDWLQGTNQTSCFCQHAPRVPGPPTRLSVSLTGPPPRVPFDTAVPPILCGSADVTNT